jgi:hypothetical protein
MNPHFHAQMLSEMLDSLRHNVLRYITQNVMMHHDP